MTENSSPYWWPLPGTKGAIWEWNDWFQIFCELEHHKIWNFARQKCGCPSMADDICQRSLVKVFTKAPGKVKDFDSPTSFRNWIYRVVRSQVGQEGRDQKKQLKAMCIGQYGHEDNNMSPSEPESPVSDTDFATLDEDQFRKRIKDLASQIEKLRAEVWRDDDSNRIKAYFVQTLSLETKAEGMKLRRIFEQMLLSLASYYDEENRDLRHCLASREDDSVDFKGPLILTVPDTKEENGLKELIGDIKSQLGMTRGRGAGYCREFVTAFRKWAKRIFFS